MFVESLVCFLKSGNYFDLCREELGWPSTFVVGACNNFDIMALLHNLPCDISCKKLKVHSYKKV